MANDYTVRVSKEARAEINRKARLNQQSSREYLDELLGIKEKPRDEYYDDVDWGFSDAEKQIEDETQYKVPKPPTTIIDAMILDCWRVESLKHWEENPIDYSRLSITSKIKFKKTPRTRQEIVNYVAGLMRKPSPFLNTLRVDDKDRSWAKVFKRFFQGNHTEKVKWVDNPQNASVDLPLVTPPSSRFTKTIANRLKELIHPVEKKNFLYRPKKGTYELELTSINEQQWQLIYALTILPPSRHTKRTPTYGYKIPPLIDILVR